MPVASKPISPNPPLASCPDLVPRAGQWRTRHCQASLICALILQERNKPIQPPAKPKAAPFFLPTVPGFSGRPQFAADDAASAVAVQGSRVGKLAGSLMAGSPLVLALRLGPEGHQQALKLLREMAPVAIDREFRALQVFVAPWLNAVLGLASSQSLWLPGQRQWGRRACMGLRASAISPKKASTAQLHEQHGICKMWAPALSLQIVV